MCFGRTQQLLSSTLSVFWGIGISCLIEYFQNDIDKIVNAFYPIFKKWVQLDYHNLKKLSDLSISIRRLFFTAKLCECKSLVQGTFSFMFSNRLIITDGAQCGAWSTWAAANKRSRNAKISHSENPSNSDAVQFFLHVLSTPPFDEFNMQAELYHHFQVLLSTPDKPLQLTAENFATKITPQRKYPECVVNTGALFDEDGDSIFSMEVTSTPVSPAAVGTKQKGTKKTGSSLKRTLGSSTTRKRKARKIAAEVVETAETLPKTQATASTPPLEPATPLLEQTPQPVPTPPVPRKAKPLSYPSLLALPSKTAIPLNANDRQFLDYSFLPISNLKGNNLFNAFVRFSAASENNIVLVSRAFASSNITLHGSYLAIRQVL